MTQWKFSDPRSSKFAFKMSYLKFLFAALVIFKIAASLPAEEKIEPVDLVYNCINEETGEESQAKSPILLLHGIGGSLKSWNGINQVLLDETKRKVCAVDFRNHGDSPWNNHFDVEALSVDIGHFLDTQGINKVNIIGQSLGGKVGIHYTLNNPDRVNSLIAEDISPNTVPEEALFQVAFAFRFLKKALKSIPEGASEDEAAKSIVDFLNKKLEQLGATERFPDKLSELLDIKLVDGKWHFKHNTEILEEAVKHPESTLTESIGLYEGPTMFIYGTKSPFKVNEDKENILKLFPNAQLVPVEGASHMIHGLYREFEDAVIPFLKNVN